MAYTEFYCIPGIGNNTNSGSTSSPPAFSSSNGGWNSVTGVWTIASGSVTGVNVGDFASVFNDGSTQTGWISRVTAVSSTTITLTTTIALGGNNPVTNATGRSITVGGPWAGPSGGVGVPLNLFTTGSMQNVNGDPQRINFKNNQTYSITSLITTLGGTQSTCFIEGYSSTPGDGGVAIIDGGTSGASYTLINFALTQWVRNFQFQNNGNSGQSDLIASSNRATFQNCVAKNARGSGFGPTSGMPVFIECEAYNCNLSNVANIGGFGGVGGYYLRCISHDNSGNGCGFTTGTSPSIYVDCIADTNGASGFFNITNGTAITMKNCVAYNNTTGLNTNGAITLSQYRIENCLFSTNTTAIILSTATGTNQCNARLWNNAFYNNTTRLTQNSTVVEESSVITLTADPFVDAVNGDFRPIKNETKGVGRGSFLQTAASYGNASMLTYPDAGIQRREPNKSFAIG